MSKFNKDINYFNLLKGLLENLNRFIYISLNNNYKRNFVNIIIF